MKSNLLLHCIHLYKIHTLMAVMSVFRSIHLFLKAYCVKVVEKAQCLPKFFFLQTGLQMSHVIQCFCSTKVNFEYLITEYEKVM